MSRLRGAMTSPDYWPTTMLVEPMARLRRWIAHNLIRMMRATNGGKLEHPLNVVLRGGTVLARPAVCANAGRFGTAECPITYMAYRDEKPIVRPADR